MIRALAVAAALVLAACGGRGAEPPRDDPARPPAPAAPPRDAATATARDAGAALTEVLDCGCGCCGAAPQVSCVDPAVETLEQVQARIAATRPSPEDCEVAGCARGIRFVYCPGGAPPPACGDDAARAFVGALCEQLRAGRADDAIRGVRLPLRWRTIASEGAGNPRFETRQIRTAADLAAARPCDGAALDRATIERDGELVRVVVPRGQFEIAFVLASGDAACELETLDER